MDNINLLNHSSLPSWMIPTILILAIWDGIWKVVAMWRAARNGQLAWFICIALLNTLGILPIIYLLTNKKKESVQESKI